MLSFAEWAPSNTCVHVWNKEKCNSELCWYGYSASTQRLSCGDTKVDDDTGMEKRRATGKKRSFEFFLAPLLHTVMIYPLGLNISFCLDLFLYFVFLNSTQELTPSVHLRSLYYITGCSFIISLMQSVKQTCHLPCHWAWKLIFHWL